MTWLHVLMLAAQLGDGLTTVHALHQGCREQLWPTQNAAVIAGTKATAAVGLTFTLPVLERRGHKRLSRAVAWSTLASGVAGMALTRAYCHG